MWVTVFSCQFPSPCWFAKNVQGVVRNSTAVNSGKYVLDSAADPNIFERMLEARQRTKRKTVEIVEQLPPLTPFLEKTPAGKIYNLLQEAPEPFVELASYGLGNELLLRVYAKIL